MYRRQPIKKYFKRIFAEQTFEFGTPWQQYSCGTVAYIVSKTGAKKLIAANTPPRVPADDWLYFEQYHQLQVLHCYPTFVLENILHLHSTIRKETHSEFYPKKSSILIRSIKGDIKNIAMNFFKMR